MLARLPDHQLAKKRAEGEGEGERGFDFLQLFNTMAAHFREKRTDMLRLWSWKFFCAEWGVLIDDAADERERQEERERQQQERETRMQVDEALMRAQMGE